MIDYREDNRWTVYVHIVPKELSEYDHDKYYVGITGRKPEERWDNGHGYLGQKHFFNAISKYGWDNLQHDIIANHLTKEQASEFEKSLIKTLKSYDRDYGYNLTLGGEGASYPYEDLSGRDFGYLKVNGLSKERGKNGERKWDCTCLLCGSETTKYENVLKSSNIISCGCYGKKQNKFISITHGKSYDKIYRKFIHLKMKCYNPNGNNYKKFGSNGITICDEWLNDFQSFYDWSINNGYDDAKVLYLKIGYKEFSSDSCIWITKSEQQQLYNTSRKYITYNNETHSMKEWAEIMGTTYTRLKDALRKKSFEEAFFYYTNQRKE